MRAHIVNLEEIRHSPLYTTTSISQKSQRHLIRSDHNAWFFKSTACSLVVDSISNKAGIKVLDFTSHGLPVWFIIPTWILVRYALWRGRAWLPEWVLFICCANACYIWGICNVCSPTGQIWTAAKDSHQSHTYSIVCMDSLNRLNGQISLDVQDCRPHGLRSSRWATTVMHWSLLSIPALPMTTTQKLRCVSPSNDRCSLLTESWKRSWKQRTQMGSGDTGLKRKTLSCIFLAWWSTMLTMSINRELFCNTTTTNCWITEA